MIWLTWRQHRALLAAAFGLLVAAAVLLIPGGQHLRSSYHSLGLGACPPLAGSCGALASAFEQAAQSSVSEKVVPWLNFLPGLLGIFTGAPLIARELEQGTHRLAWTQTITRRRWLLSKLALLAAATVVTAATLTALLAWYRLPLDRVDGRFFPNAFDFEGVAPTGYALFAFALGTLAGSVLRRTVAAMAVSMSGYLAVRETVELWLRPQFQKPVTTTFDLAAQAGDHSNRTGDWVLSSGIANHLGQHLSSAATNEVYRNAGADSTQVNRYFHAHGLLRWVTYQPAHRFWTFQAIETTLFLTLASAMLVLAIRRVRHTG